MPTTTSSIAAACALSLSASRAVTPSRVTASCSINSSRCSLASSAGNSRNMPSRQRQLESASAAAATAAAARKWGGGKGVVSADTLGGDKAGVAAPLLNLI
eukprot:scaffold10799_cov86-Isochrysis_galbana.AAC.1